MSNPFSKEISPDWESFLACIQRKGTPDRVHYIELFLDREVKEDLCRKFNLLDGMDVGDPYFLEKRALIIQRFLGYDYVRGCIENLDMPLSETAVQDTSLLARDGGRSFIDEGKGPISNWEEFEKYPWPDPQKTSYRQIEWLDKNLPDDMCIVCHGGFAHFAEYLTWLMGYQTLCYALFDTPDLVQAITDRLLEIYIPALEGVLQFDGVKVIWGSDDMGFKTSTLISPADLRKYVLPGHKKMAEMAHSAGRPYLIHSCGKLTDIMADLIDDVQIDGKHSFEDTIEDVRDVKKEYGQKIALLGGIDVDFLCRAEEDAIRARVRETLDVCLPGGGYCLGSGNTIANYVPIQNYLAMLDEGRNYKP